MFKTKEEALNNISKMNFSDKEFDLFRNDKEVVLEAVKQGGWALEYTSDELKNDKEVVLEAVKQNGHALYFASKRLRDDKEVVLEAVKQDAMALEYTSDELKNDKEVVLEAVKQDYWALEYASDELKNNKEVVLEAVKQDGWALELASDKLRNDKDILNAVRDYLMSDSWVGNLSEDIFFKAKENLLKYDREDRENELLSKLSDLDRLQAQQQNSINQPKAEVKSRRKV